MTDFGYSMQDSYLEKVPYVLLQNKKTSQKHKLLIIDDEEDNLQLLKRTLRLDYEIFSAYNGSEAMATIEKMGDEISLIISDQRMPVMTGTEFFAKIVDKHPKIIKMLLTGYADTNVIIDSVNKCELFQYVLKPFDPDELKVIVKDGIKARELLDSKEAIIKDLKELFYTTIKSISSALDAKDTYTSGHSFRVTLYSLILAKILNLDEAYIEQLETAGLLHDIGKIGVPDDILSKPGKLTDEEYSIMKSHPEQGKKILNGIKKLSSVSLWLNSHHERWDGRGYPEGLKEKEIPLNSRILAIADTYDAMTSNRAYRKALSHEIAVEEIKHCSDSQFDPEIVEAFLSMEEEFRAANINPYEYYRKYSVLNLNFTEKD